MKGLNFKELNKLLINLPERKDRLESFKKEIVYLPCSNLQIVSGVRNHTHPFKGIAQAHMNCILIAMQNEWEQVLIMEDDVCFQGGEQTYDYLLTCLENLPDKWDVLLGGIYFHRGNLESYNDYWNKVNEFCGLHFYIVNSSAYEKILSYEGDQHIDRWMNQNSRLNCFVTSKFVATQKDGFSDNTKLKTDYGNFIKKFKVL